MTPEADPPAGYDPLAVDATLGRLERALLRFADELADLRRSIGGGDPPRD